MDQTFHAIIEVVNRATAPLRAIQGQIAGLVVPITAVKLAMGELAVQTGITAVGEDAALAMEKVGALGRSIGALLGPLALVGGIASIGGLAEITKKSAEFGKSLLASHEKTGVDVPVLARLHYVAQLSDTDPEVLDKALYRLNVNLFNAMRGKNKDMAAMMQHFVGPNWKHEVKDAGDAFAVLSDHMRKNSSEAVRAGIVATAFGARVGQNLIPMLLRGGDDIRRLGDDFDRFYGIMSPERAEQMAASADQLLRLKAASEGLAITIGGVLGPVLTPLVKGLGDWVAQNRELIATKIADTVKQIGAALKNVDWQGIGSAIMSVGRGFAWVGETLGAKGTIFLAAAVIFGPIAVQAAQAAVAVGRLGVQIGLTAIKVGILAATSAFGFFTDLVAGIRLAIPVISALDLALDANPIGAFVIAATALAGVGYLIYKNWSPISQWFSDTWHGIIVTLDGAWSAMKPTVDKIVEAFDRINAARSGHKTSAERDRAGRNPKAAAANRAAFNKVVNEVWGTMKIMAGINLISGLHDIGANDRQMPTRIVPAGPGAAAARRGAARDAGAPRQPLIDPARSGAAALGRAVNGNVNVQIDFNNLPPGVTAKAAAAGDGLNLNVGKTFKRP